MTLTVDSKNAECGLWETQELAQVDGESAAEFKAYMVQKYESKLKGNVMVAVEESKAMIEELQNLVRNAQVLLEEMRGSES
jgi:hypothetical protein